MDIIDDVPLVSFISRLVDQKGLDLIQNMLWELIDLGIQFVVLGTGDKKYEDFFLYAQSQLPGKVSANIKYDGVLAQRLYAASDMYLCHLCLSLAPAQIFSMRYGTVPVVVKRELDTVKPYNV